MLWCIALSLWRKPLIQVRVIFSTGFLKYGSHIKIDFIWYDIFQSLKYELACLCIVPGVLFISLSFVPWVLCTNDDHLLCNNVSFSPREKQFNALHIFTHNGIFQSSQQPMEIKPWRKDLYILHWFLFLIQVKWHCNDKCKNGNRNMLN